MDPNSEAYLRTLHSLISKHFTIDALQNLCLDLGGRYENLWGDDKNTKIDSLLTYLAENTQLKDLLELLKTAKPQVTWPPIPEDFDYPIAHEMAMSEESAEVTPRGHLPAQPNEGHVDSIGGDDIDVGDISDSHVAIGEGAAVHVFSGDFQGANITILPSATTDTEPVPLIEEAIRLDVATPTKVVEHEVFDVAVAVRQPASPLLSVADLTAVTSGEGAIFRTEADEVIIYRIAVTGSGFTVVPESYIIKLRPNKDSRISFFQLTPQGMGKKTIVVNAYQKDDTLAAQTRIRIEVVVAVNHQ